MSEIYPTTAFREGEGTEGRLERVRHLKRGFEYEVLGEAEVQVATGSYQVWPKGSDPYSDEAAVPARLAHDGNTFTIYRCLKTGKLWCRFTDEFRDGRFETIASAPSPDRAGDGGDLGEQTGACLTAPGSSPTGDAPHGSSSQATAIPSREPADVSLADCPVGLFWSNSGELCVKTEYGDNSGRINAFIVSTGEFFCGDPPQTVASQRQQMVRPIDWQFASKVLTPGFAAAIPSGGWRPIETAPTEKGMLLQLFEPHVVGGFQFVGCRGADGGWFNNLDHVRQRPTYWRPLLPYPPSVSDRSGEAVETTGSTGGESTATSVATPKHSPEPNPPMSVEEAREAAYQAAADKLDAIGRHHGWFNGSSSTKDTPWRELDPIGREEFLDVAAAIVEAALRTLSEHPAPSEAPITTEADR